MERILFVFIVWVLWRIWKDLQPKKAAEPVSLETEIQEVTPPVEEPVAEVRIVQEADEPAVLILEDEPAWFTNGVFQRPWSIIKNTSEAVKEGQLMAPFPTPSIDPTGWGLDTLNRFVNLHCGLEMPDDLSVAYWPPYSEEMRPEHPDLPITPEMAVKCSGMSGVDQLHNALLIICGTCASAVGLPEINGTEAAALCYHAATGAAVGSGSAREQQVELDLNEWLSHYQFYSLQEAVEFIFWQYSLPHTASIEYIMAEHPPVWRW